MISGLFLRLLKNRGSKANAYSGLSQQQPLPAGPSGKEMIEMEKGMEWVTLVSRGRKTGRG